MNNLQKVGGVAALIGAATNLVAIGMFLTLLAPKGYGSENIAPDQIVTFLADHQTIMHIWYLIIFEVFGFCLIVLSLALYERLKAGSIAIAPAVTAFGLIWAVLVIAVGMLSINDLGVVVALYSKDPAQAATVWLTLDSVETGLGAGGGETIVNALWFLLVSWAAWRAGELPKVLNYLGVTLGVTGIFSVIVPGLSDLIAIFGLGLIVWFAWTGIALLRNRPNAAV